MKKIVFLSSVVLLGILYSCSKEKTAINDLETVYKQAKSGSFEEALREAIESLEENEKLSLMYNSDDDYEIEKLPLGPPPNDGWIGCFGGSGDPSFYGCVANWCAANPNIKVCLTYLNGGSEVTAWTCE